MSLGLVGRIISIEKWLDFTGINWQNICAPCHTWLLYLCLSGFSVLRLSASQRASIAVIVTRARCVFPSFCILHLRLHVLPGFLTWGWHVTVNPERREEKDHGKKGMMGVCGKTSKLAIMSYANEPHWSDRSRFLSVAKAFEMKVNQVLPHLRTLSVTRQRKYKNVCRLRRGVVFNRGTWMKRIMGVMN